MVDSDGIPYEMINLRDYDSDENHNLIDSGGIVVGGIAEEIGEEIDMIEEVGGLDSDGGD